MTSNYMPDVQVEIAFDSGYSTPEGSRTWTDVSAYVELAEGISIGYGRADEFAVTDANSLSLTLDNSDGRFTAGRAASPYYPNVRIGRPIRVTATPVGGTPSVRFLGYVDEWPVAWDGTDNYAKAAITARSRLARLGFDATISGLLRAEFLRAGPSNYWPLNEAAGATSANDLIANAQMTPYFTLVPAFGSPTGLADPADTGALVSSSNRTMRASLSPTPSTAAGVTLEAFVSGGAGEVALRTGYTTSIDVFIGHSGGAAFAGISDGLGTSVSVLGPAVDDSLPHHLLVTAMCSGGSTAISLYVDGVLAGTNPDASNDFPTDVQFPIIQFGNYSAPHTVSNIAVNASPSNLAERVAAGLTGGAGELAGDRIIRYAALGGIDPAEVSVDSDTSPVGLIDTDGSTALDSMRKVEATESGVLFDARDNTLTFKGRAARYNAATAFTVDVAEHEVETDVTPKLDRSTLTNDVAATASDGTTARAINQTSIDDYGYARQSLDIASTNDAAYQAAAWRVALYAEPAPRIPSLGVNLLPLSQTRQDDLFELDISSVIEVENFPTQAAVTSAEFFVEGYTENIGQESYMFVFNVSPTTGHDVWTIEDPVFGQYDAYPIAQ